MISAFEKFVMDEEMISRVFEMMEGVKEEKEELGLILISAICLNQDGQD